GAYESVTGIEAVNQAANLTVSPNPGNGLFGLKLTGAINGVYETQVFDATGKMIYSYHIENTSSLLLHTFDLQNQPKGIYTLKLINNNKVLTHKVVKL
ncbi:MAG TPA: T9SS type A sorting domain-containing protein, partial [Bacteroidia bacterium]|nr:T9SS type A sorting domain-containing protein [Bacteroidia bacterium]